MYTTQVNYSFYKLSLKTKKILLNILTIEANKLVTCIIKIFHAIHVLNLIYGKIHQNY